MHHADVSEDIVARLLDVCHDGGVDAARLASQTHARELQSLLVERAHQYRCAERELRARLPRRQPGGDANRAVDAEIPKGDRGVVLAWEVAECSALIYFRDAYDASLPSDLKETVKRHLEEGVVALERLRALQVRDGSNTTP